MQTNYFHLFIGCEFRITRARFSQSFMKLDKVLDLVFVELELRNSKLIFVPFLIRVFIDDLI